MNLSGIWNSLPDLLRSQQADNLASATSSVESNRTGNASSETNVPNAGKTDHADLSGSGLAIAQSAGQSEISDVRMDKVNTVRAAIENGTYQVSAQDVAGKVIQSLLG